MSVNRLKKILDDFDEKCGLYESFTGKMRKLIEELLDENEVSVHSVTCRVKDRDKLKEKIRKNEGKFEKLENITDISGLRIITFFADDVDVVARIIQKEFVIDPVNSVDKREIMQSDRFGYLSLHYISSLNEERAKLTEYERYKGFKCEIQIRSILQHAWAEIEHDLGYSIELEIPWQIRRRFTRIAGLLEVADSEFIEIKDQLASYNEVIIHQIIEKPEEVYIDKPSITLFIAKNHIVKEINQEISTLSGFPLLGEEVRTWDFPSLIQELNFLKISSISQLEAKLIEKRDVIIKFAVSWLKSSQRSEVPGTIDSSISLWYLNYCLAGETGSLDYIIEFLKIVRIDAPYLDKIAKNIIETYNKYKT